MTTKLLASVLAVVWLLSLVAGARALGTFGPRVAADVVVAAPEPPPHAAYCQCVRCVGGKHCCCKPPESAVEARRLLVLRAAVCDAGAPDTALLCFWWPIIGANPGVFLPYPGGGAIPTHPRAGNVSVLSAPLSTPFRPPCPS